MTITSEPSAAVRPERRKRPLRLRIHTALHWLHIYISMFSLLVILFFAVTGITLNHPDWALTEVEAPEPVNGTFPEGWRTGDEVDWLRVVEYLRAEHGVRGELREYQVSDLDGSLLFIAPGYSAEAYFDPETGEYELSTLQLGTLVVLNELHRGQDAASSWRWVIDAAGVFLAALSVTGLGLLLYLRRYRRSALLLMAAGSVAVLILMQMVT